jgi:hypothetical protein
METNMRNSLLAVRRVLATAGIMVSAAITLSCDATERLLEAEDPDLVPPENVNSPDGAEGVRLGAMRRWSLTTAGPNTNGSESTWLFGGLLTDEWGTASTFVQNDQVDTRRTGADNSTVTNAFRALNRVRTAANQAIPLMREWRPTEATRLAELYLARAFAEMQLASDFCNGIPLSDAATADGIIIYGDPISGDSVFKLSVITADSGIALATATDTQTTNILFALRVIRARSSMATATTPAARAAVAAQVTTALIPTAFSYNHTFSTTTGDNGIWGQPNSNRRYLVGDSVEGNSRNILVRNAIPFFSSRDPRLPANYTITTTAGRTDTTKSQDGLTNSRITPLYGRTTSIAVANGIDARLIEAEAQLNAGNVAGTNGMLPILNGLRGSARSLGTVTTPVMAALADPGTQAGQEDLLFREKAFWTFSRGQRLGDMRRLIRQYGRSATDVYPEGQHYRGTTYGTDLTLPIPQQELNNPKYTGGCNTQIP